MHHLFQFMEIQNNFPRKKLKTQIQKIFMVTARY